MPPGPAEALRRARTLCAPSCAPRAWRPHSHAERTRRHRPGRGPGLAPRPGPAGLHRQQAGSEVGGRYHLYPHLGGVRVPGDRPRAAARRKQSGTRLGRQHVAPAPGVRGDRHGGPQVPVHKRRDGIPLGPGVPVHLRAARQAPGELRHSPFGGQDRGVLGQCLGGSRRVRPSRNERVYQMVYPTRSKAIRDIASWIELEYNQKRLHSALGYRTQGEVDQEHRAVRQAA